MKSWFTLIVFNLVCWVLSNEYIDIQNLGEADKLYKTQYKPQCFNEMRYLQTADPHEDESSSSTAESNTSTEGSTGSTSSDSSSSTTANPSSTTPTGVPSDTSSTTAGPSSATPSGGSPTSDVTDELTLMEDKDDADYNPEFGDTSVYTTNPNLLKKMSQTPRKLFSGSFWSTIGKYAIKNYTDVISKSTLKMVISVGRNGVYRPDSNILGDWFDEQGHRVHPEFTVDESQYYTDIYGLPWHQKVKVDEKGFAYAKNYSDAVKALYTGFGLLTGNPNETDFITSEVNVTMAYTKQLTQYMYPQFNGTNVETAPFTFEDFNKFNYNPKTSGKIVAVLQREYLTKYFGFGMDSCPKWKNFQTKASKDNLLLEEYNTVFAPLIKNLLEKFKDKIDYKPFGLNDTYFRITKEQLESNFTLVKILIEALRSDMDYFQNEPEQFTALRKYILQTAEDFVLTKNLRKFITYELTLYSHLHTFLVIGPFYDLMFDQFNKVIESKGTFPRKFLHFTVSEWIISAIYKMMNYDKSYYRGGWDPNDSASNKEKWFYKKMPFVYFGYNIQFELWEMKEKSRAYYYIMFRENLAAKPLFILKAEDFMWALKLFYMDPNFDPEERVFWCGS
jgi:hypothetical protein